MRGLKSFAILLVIAIGLLTYVFVVERKRTPGDDVPAKEKAFAVEADKIEEVTIKSESGERTTLRKSGAEWQITAPVSAVPDSAEVSGLTSNLSSVEIQRVIEENAADLKEFGLAEPRIEVAFKAGGQQHTLRIGRKTPTGNDLYAAADGQNKVFLIPSFLESTFNRGTFDLRDKAVLKLDTSKVDAVEVATADQTLRFAKKQGEWEIEQPLATRGDYGAIDGLVNRVASAQMKSIVATDPTGLKQYGLDKPAATIRVNSGSSQAALALGAGSAEGTVYAKDLSRPAVFTVDSTLLDDLRKDVTEYRQKDLFDARAFNATRIEVTRNGQTTAFEKTKVKGKDGQDEEKWRQVAPSAKDLDSAKIEAFLSTLTGARALGFATGSTKTNLDKPELSVVVTFDAKEERVSFAREGANAYAERAGSPGAATLDGSTLDGILNALAEIK